jgi:glycosyltransferase involved in cell wall biosynthesis
VKVLVLGHTAELGGAEIGMVSMARYLPADVRVALLEDGPLAHRLRTAGCAVEVHDLRAALTPPPRDRRRARDVARHARALAALRRTILDEVARHSADVVLLNTLRIARLAAACALPRRVRCVTMLRDGLRPPHISRRDAVIDQVAINAVSRAVVANSAWTRGQLVTSRPTSVVPPFVAADFFDTPLVPRVDPDELRVLMLGRMAHWKGQLLGLRALAACRTPRRLAVTVAGGTWFGETGHQDKVRRFAREHPELHVDVAGHVDEVVELIDRHDVLLHTSLMPEPFGQVIVQGMARGRIVVAADRGGPAEVIRSGRDGLLYRMGSEDDLARTLEQVAGDGPELAAIRTNAVRSAHEYRPERTATRLRDALDEVVGATSRRPSRPRPAYSARCSASPTSCACCSPAPHPAESASRPAP